jgi:hypothetical protein
LGYSGSFLYTILTSDAIFSFFCTITCRVRAPTFWVHDLCGSVDALDRNGGDDGNGDSAHDDVDNDGVIRQVDYSFLPVFAAGCDKALVIVSNRMFRTPSAVLQLFAAMAVHCEPERVCTFDALNACTRLWRTLCCCLDNADRVLKCSRCSFLSSRLLHVEPTVHD